MSQIKSVPQDILPIGLFDDPKYAKMAVENAEKYKTASPYPHILIDNFIDPKIAMAVAEEIPDPKKNISDWVVRDNANTHKVYQHDETKLPLLLRMLMREFNSRQFILFLETLTGIDNLIPDPYYIGGGIHLGGPGAFLNIHADFNWHHKLQTHRRVNILLYLNPRWKQEWGGALELWDKPMTKAEQAYYPLFNRLIIFNTDKDSNHGHPHPVTCPDDEYRISLNMYFYTTRIDESKIHEPHFTLYKTQASKFASELGDNYRKTAEDPKE